MFSHGIGYQLWLMGSHFSRIFNFLMGGSLEETFSFRVAKEEDDCSFCNFCCRVLDKFDLGHCKDSVAWWKEHGINICPEHRPIVPWIIFWSLIGAMLIFRPFGLL